MVTFQYKTKGGSSPYGKPNLYFSCHPQDFSCLFPEISKELLSGHNCVIWYTGDCTFEPEDNFYAKLKEMQLVVIPITRRLLTTENPVLSFVLPFALENHIPVLPFLLEKELDEPFRHAFGDLQYLDKTSIDETAISYEEKLDKYLTSILVGDELAQKVRDAFDAYVFLSYRKKDRLHAQELMRLIHKNAFCRDIAIWYDEFLTPGEDFNDSIRDAVMKSDLFVMAVTPNLVNEQNYIISKEYPLAQKVHKPILPTQLIPTDAALLKRYFQDIPDCTDAYDDSALSEALLEHLKGVALRENDHSLEHNYFIGLAYLNGIDVEVDYTKALSLITSCANAGLLEAIDKLSHMYQVGMGVTRSYDMSLFWQEKKIDLLEEQYETNNSADHLYALASARKDLGNSILDIYQDYTKAKEHFLCTVEELSSCPFIQTQERMALLLAVTLLRLAWITGQNDHDYPRALSYIREALMVQTPFSSDNPSLEQRRILSLSYNLLGIISGYTGKLLDEKRAYEKAIHFRRSLAEETYHPTDRYNLAVLYNNMALHCMNQYLLEEALDYGQQALTINLSLSEERGSVQDKSSLAHTYGILCDIYDRMDNRAKAIRQRFHCLEILEALAQETGMPDIWHQIAQCHGRLAYLYENDNNLTLALEHAQKALNLRLSLIENNNSLAIKRQLKNSYYHLSYLNGRLGNEDLKYEYRYHEYELKYQIIQESTHTDEDLFSCAEDFLGLAWDYLEEDHVPKAIPCCDLATKILQAFPPSAIPEETHSYLDDIIEAINNRSNT